MNILYLIVVGLIAGWLAGQVMRGGGYGVLVDIILGILGGIVGGWLFGKLGIWPGGGVIGDRADHEYRPATRPACGGGSTSPANH